MRAMSKSELAHRAGVSVKTLNRWCLPYRLILENMGVTPNMRVLPPKAVMFIAETFCIDVDD